MSLEIKNVDKQMIEDARALIAFALSEDIGSGDVTCEAVIPESATLEAVIRIREPGVVCGLWAATMVFESVDAGIHCQSEVEEGQTVDAGQVLMTLQGPARGILTAERTALNLLQHLCGISTFTQNCVARLGDSETHLLDTRKTTPGMRRLEKYAVRCGGGKNHRMGLYDRIMVKDNHLALRSELSSEAVDFKAIVDRARSSHPGIDIQIEVDTVEQFAEAKLSKPDWILLDNMSLEEMTRCVQSNPGRILLEASGNVTLDRLPEIAACGVDAISMGALTQHARTLDIGLDYL